MKDFLKEFGQGPILLSEGLDLNQSLILNNTSIIFE